MNYYAVSAFINAITSFTLAGFVALRNWNNLVSRRFVFFALSVGIWSAFYVLWQVEHSSQLALFWTRALMGGAIWIPTLFLHFVFTLVGTLQQVQSKRLLTVGYSLTLLYFLTDFSPWFIADVVPRAGFRFWPVPGIFFHLYLIQFVSSVLYAHVLMFKAIRRQHSALLSNQVKYVFLGTLIGYSGGLTNFPLWYDINIPPWGNWFVAVYIVMVAYAIARYRLMDITLAVTRTAILVVVYSVILGLPLLALLSFRSMFTKGLGDFWWLIPFGGVSYAVLASVAPFAFLFFQRKAEARLLREQRHYQTTLLNAAKGMTQIRDLQHLLSLIVHMLTRSMKLTHAGVFMEDGRTGRYVLQASRDRDVLVKGLALEPHDTLIAWLKRERAPLVSEEIRQMVNGTVSPANLEATLKQIGASVVVPSFAEDQLIGFLVLGDKKTGQMYSQDDLNALQTLANQAALAVQNAQFYQELQAKTAELIHESRLKSMGKMASGLSHQIHNRLMVLGGEAMLFAEMHLPRLRAATSPVEREQLMDKLASTLTSIAEESVKGKEIVKKLLDFSKPATNKALTSLKAVVEGGLRMVSLNHQAQLERCQVHLVLSDQPRLEVNFTQLEDVFFNLFDNALDAIKSKVALLERQALTLPPEQLPYQGTLTVTATPAEDRTRLLVRVADNGLGMSPEDEDQLFLPFFTTKGTAEKGTGMGLFIIREIVRAHGGDIRLEQAAYGQGTTFLLELPIQEAERAWGSAGS